MERSGYSKMSRDALLIVPTDVYKQSKTFQTYRLFILFKKFYDFCVCKHSLEERQKVNEFLICRSFFLNIDFANTILYLQKNS